MRTSFLRQSLPLLLLVTLASAGSVARGEEFHSPYGYRLTTPSTWKTIPSDIIQQAANALLNDSSKSKVISDAGFQVKANQEWFEYPYVLVQVIPYNKLGMTRQIYDDELPKVMQSITGTDINKEIDSAVSSDVRPMLSSASLGKPTLDRANRRYTVPLSMTVAGAGKVRGLIVGNFGHDSLVQVCFYSMDSNWNDHVAEGQAIIDSFHFDADKAYRPEESKSSIWDGVMGKGLMYGIIGGLVGLFAWIGTKFKKKPRTY